MIYKVLAALDRKVNFPAAQAHCDIPCGIYDPITAQIAALTVVRMLDLMADLDASTTDKLAYHNSMSRYITVKEEHAEKAKHEIRVIFGDYIKAPQIEKYPELPTLVHKIMMAGSKVRQSTDRAAAVEFVELINQFAQIFWETKGLTTKRAKAPYKPELELVYPNL